MHLKLLIVYQNCCQIKVLEGCCGPCCPRKKKCVYVLYRKHTWPFQLQWQCWGVCVCVLWRWPFLWPHFFPGLTHSTIQTHALTHTHMHISKDHKRSCLLKWDFLKESAWGCQNTSDAFWHDYLTWALNDAKYVSQFGSSFWKLRIFLNGICIVPQNHWFDGVFIILTQASVNILNKTSPLCF